MPELKELTLESIAAGAASELFDHALAEVLANIRDPNTDAEAKRTIKLEFVFNPHRSRNEAAVSVEVSSKLAGVLPASGYLFVAREDGQLVAYTNDVQQENLPLETVDKTTGEVLPMKGRRGA